MPLAQTSLGFAARRTVNLDIEYFERPGYSETWDLDGGEAKRVFLCNWGDSRLFPRAMLGDVRRSSSPQFLDRETHEPFPDSSKVLWAVGCVLRGTHGAPTMGTDSSLIEFTDRVNNLEGFAEWEVTYRSLPYDVLADARVRRGLSQDAKDVNVNGERLRYVSKTFKMNTEVFQLPGVLFSWPDGSPIPEGMGKQRHWLEMRYTWHWVPEPLPIVIFALEDGAAGVPLVGTVARAQGVAEAQRQLDFEIARAPNADRATAERSVREARERLAAARAAAIAEGNIDEALAGDLLPQALPFDDVPPATTFIADPIRGRAIEVPRGTVKVSIGKVNANAFDGFGPGHLLCTVAEISARKWTPAGTPVRDITYVFAVRPDAPWNSFYKRNSGRFERVQVRNPQVRESLRAAGLPYEPYGTANFDQLFWP